VLRNPYLSVSRNPRDSSIELHRLADDWFFSKFKIRFRSAALFGNGNSSVVAKYVDADHRAISLMPRGEFTICYSPNCVDMYEHFKAIGRHPWSREKVFVELDSLDYMVGSDELWAGALQSGCEIMMYAQEFIYQHEEL
jgi:hypothetical protein